MGREVYRQSLADMLGDFVEVAPVVFGQDDFLDAGAAGGDEFFAHAADGEDFPGEGDFAGHGDASHRPVTGQGEEGGGDGDPGGWAVLGGGPGGHMEVDEGVFEEFGVGAEFRGLTDQVAVGDLGRFLHDVAELAGELEAVLEFVGAHGLDAEGGAAAQGGPGQPGDQAGSGQPPLVPEHGAAQVVLEVPFGHRDRRFPAFEHPDGALAHDLAELFFQAPHAGVPGVAFDKGAQGAGVEFDGALVQTGLFDLPRQEVFSGDL